MSYIDPDNIDPDAIMAEHDRVMDSPWEDVEWCRSCWLALSPDDFHGCEPYVLAREIKRLRLELSDRSDEIAALRKALGDG